MNKQIIIKVVLILLWTLSICCASESKTACKCPKCAAARQVAEGKINEVDKVLQQLNQKTSELKSFQAQVEYRFIQPLLESEKLQKGDFYYAKLGNTSKLRLNFKTSQIDDEDEEKYVEEYIVFDGVGLSHPGQKFKGMWAVQIDYEMEGVRYIQLAEAGDPNKPTDVFDLINKNFPMIGFSRIEDIRKQFEITLVKQKKSGSEDFIQVHLDVKPNSVYKDDYVFIDFWIDKKTGLPAKIVTVSTEPATEPVELKDVSEIKFLNSKFNNKIAKKVFDFKIPAGFDEPEIMPLKKKDG
ncbi:MAG: LolA family protein [Planctomycetota bacterium]